MSVRSVEEIIKLSDSHSNPNRIAYRHLLKQLDLQIRERAVRHGSLSFRTPSILFGKPAFEKGTVEKKIIKHYTKIGFSCYRNSDDDIIIKWKEEEPEIGGYADESDDMNADTSSDDESSSQEGSGDEENDSDSDSDQGDSTRKHVVVEKATFSQRLSDVGK